MAETEVQDSGVRSPMDDSTYDLVSILHNKAKALEAYEQYEDDLTEDSELVELIGRIRRDDEEHVRLLKQHLFRLLAREHESSDAGEDTSDDVSASAGEGDESAEEGSAIAKGRRSARTSLSGGRR